MKKLSAFLILFLAITSFVNCTTREELQQYAIDRNDYQLMEVLMKYGDRPGYPILNCAMEATDYFAVFLLIEYGVDINSRFGPNTQTVLERAIGAGEIALVEYFLLKGADPTNTLKYGQTYTNSPYRYSDYVTTAIHDAIKLERLDVLILFAQYRVDLNKYCYERSSNYQQAFKMTPLRTAIEYKKNDIASFLVSIGAKI